MIFKIVKWITIKIRMYWLSRKSIKFIGHSIICNQTKFEGHNSIGVQNKLLHVLLGLGTYTGEYVRLNSVKVGRFCSIASGVKNVTGNHPTSKFVSTHPAFFSRGKAAGYTFSTEQKFEELKRLENGYLVEIGNDVWIGEDVLILDGIKIGDGAIVGSRSLVTKDIPPYAICVGSPAKVIRYRFSTNEIKNLIEIKWWNWSFDKIKKHSTKFEDIELFLKEIANEDNN
jgi:acetyltransferase-like isoleucine patch superfamily enzyme